MRRWQLLALFLTIAIGDDFLDVLSFTMPSTYKIRKPVPHDEIARMFRVINRNTAIGKRDYAMFMIAVVTGSRIANII